MADNSETVVGQISVSAVVQVGTAFFLNFLKLPGDKLHNGLFDDDNGACDHAVYSSFNLATILNRKASKNEH